MMVILGFGSLLQLLAFQISSQTHNSPVWGRGLWKVEALFSAFWQTDGVLQKEPILDISFQYIMPSLTWMHFLQTFIFAVFLFVFMVILMYSKSMMPLLNILVHAGLVAKTLELFETAQAFLKNAFCCKNMINTSHLSLFSRRTGYWREAMPWFLVSGIVAL